MDEFLEVSLPKGSFLSMDEFLEEVLLPKGWGWDSLRPREEIESFPSLAKRPRDMEKSEGIIIHHL